MLNKIIKRLLFRKPNNCTSSDDLLGEPSAIEV